MTREVKRKKSSSPAISSSREKDSDDSKSQSGSEVSSSESSDGYEDSKAFIDPDEDRKREDCRDDSSYGCKPKLEPSKDLQLENQQVLRKRKRLPKRDVKPANTGKHKSGKLKLYLEGTYDFSNSDTDIVDTYNLSIDRNFKKYRQFITILSKRKLFRKLESGEDPDERELMDVCWSLPYRHASQAWRNNSVEIMLKHLKDPDTRKKILDDCKLIQKDSAARIVPVNTDAIIIRKYIRCRFDNQEELEKSGWWQLTKKLLEMKKFYNKDNKVEKLVYNYFKQRSLEMLIRRELEKAGIASFEEDLFQETEWNKLCKKTQSLLKSKNIPDRSFKGAFHEVLIQFLKETRSKERSVDETTQANATWTKILLNGMEITPSGLQSTKPSSSTDSQIVTPFTTANEMDAGSQKELGDHSRSLGKENIPSDEPLSREVQGEQSEKSSSSTAESQGGLSGSLYTKELQEANSQLTAPESSSNSKVFQPAAESEVLSLNCGSSQGQLEDQASSRVIIEGTMSTETEMQATLQEETEAESTELGSTVANNVPLQESQINVELPLLQELQKSNGFLASLAQGNGTNEKSVYETTEANATWTKILLDGMEITPSGLQSTKPSSSTVSQIVTPFTTANEMDAGSQKELGDHSRSLGKENIPSDEPLSREVQGEQLEKSSSSLTESQGDLSGSLSAKEFQEANSQLSALESSNSSNLFQATVESEVLSLNCGSSQGQLEDQVSSRALKVEGTVATETEMQATLQEETEAESTELGSTVANNVPLQESQINVELPLLQELQKRNGFLTSLIAQGNGTNDACQTMEDEDGCSFLVSQKLNPSTSIDRKLQSTITNNNDPWKCLFQENDNDDDCQIIEKKSDCEVIIIAESNAHIVKQKHNPSPTTTNPSTVVKPSNFINTTAVRKDLSDVESNFAQMYHKDASKDLTFVIGQSLVKAHSFVIEAMCESFYRQILPHTKQKEIELKDISIEVFDAFIRYLYFGNFEEHEETVMGLLKLGIKHKMLKLWIECERYLIKMVNKHNAIQYLIEACALNAEFVKEKALSEIKYNLKELKETEDFKLLLKRPEILALV